MNELLNRRLEGKPWTVVDILGRSPDATGGNYSFPYLVRNDDGSTAFLKVFDFSAAHQAPDVALAIQGMVNAYVHERELLKRCGAKGLNRVVRAIDSGTITDLTAPSGAVFYLIFEKAQCDARHLMDTMRGLDLSWRLRTLHQITVGRNQLHAIEIAHQDLKPSNVLSFGQKDSRLGDLGRACCEQLVPPHQDEGVPGDPDYAPPELLYNQIEPDWKRRRLGCDLYLLGSMVVYLFTNQATTHLIMASLNSVHKPERWGDSYAGVLPFVREASCHMLEVFEKHISWNELRRPIVSAVQQLCEPDPTLRGHPLERGRYLNQFSLQRYLGLFDCWSRKAEISRL